MRFSKYLCCHRVAKILFLIVGVLFLQAACASKSSSSEEKKGGRETDAAKAEAPISVTTAKVEAREVPSFIQATGSLIAQETSDVVPKVAGKVVNVSANVGEFVGWGSVIARIDDRDARLRLGEAQAGVAQAIAGVRQAEARLGLAQNGTFSATTIPEVRASNANYEQAVVFAGVRVLSIFNFHTSADSESSASTAGKPDAADDESCSPARNNNIAAH